jgi:hypothetical protein
MHLEGSGRNEISRILAQQGLHVSEGSVGNIVRAYRKHEQSLQSDTPGIEHVNPKIVTPRDGGPLSHFLGEDTSAEKRSMTPIHVMTLVDYPKPPVKIHETLLAQIYTSSIPVVLPIPQFQFSCPKPVRNVASM